MGIPGQMGDERVGEATQKVVDACKEHGLVPAKFIWDKNSALEAKQTGVRLLTHTADLFILVGAAARAVEEMKD